MGSLIRILILLIGLVLSFTVFFFLIKKKINERNTLMWLAGCLGIILLSAFPGLLDWLAALVGVSYPPSLLFLASAVILLMMVLYQSMQISVMNEKIKQMSQHIALRGLDETEVGKRGDGADSGSI